MSDDAKSLSIFSFSGLQRTMNDSQVVSLGGKAGHLYHKHITNTRLMSYGVEAGVL